ncbi:ankyrin, partial [Piromyces finnis]
MLIENNVDVNIKDIYGNTPFIYMLKYSKKNKDIYNALVNAGAFIDYILFNDENFINNIILNDYFIELYINKKIRVKYDNDSVADIISTPLIFAIKLNHVGFIKTLLNNNIKVDEIDDEKNDPLIVASKINNSEIIELLNEYFKKFNFGSEQVSTEVKNDINNDSVNNSKISEIDLKEDEIRKLYKEDYNIDFKCNENDDNCYTEFYLASLNGNTLMINTLFESNKQCDMFDANKQSSKYKFTPLMMLIVKGDYENAKLFLENHADPNVRDIYNNTPLMYMLKYSKYNVDIYNLLIENGAYIDYKLFLNSNFVYSIIKNFLFIRHLINKKIRINYEDDNEIKLVTKPLIFSIETNYSKFVEEILKNNVNIN